MADIFDYGTTARFTDDGGLAFKFINNTGQATVKGSVMQASPNIDDAVELQADQFDSIGVMYSDGVADGEECWVTCYGKCYVLLEDGTAATRGYWVFSADADGRGNASLADPPGGTVTEIDNHFKELGHCLESVSAGTDKLALVFIHFN